MRLSSLSERLLIVVLRSIIPSEDAHQSEYVAPSDKRREWISWYVSILLSFLMVYLTSV
jgi:hypothetical protein